ncbi:PadR family transcriptional regulator [Haladaptatus pallidirubidus]|uniref:PadR family transcriptional regulator n=1 Tax=Haladaptatus pallidirubidus TaxID=1008152 RepID=A0AAV3UBP6_9EURY|nr:PadR family transcriptional regulator [Haladaptatus pallidirubidus]
MSIRVISDLTEFQLTTLGVIAELDAREGDCYGLAIKRRLEDYYGEQVNHGRLYPNLDTLVQDGLVDKRPLDRRTNEYVLSDSGREALETRRDWINRKLNVGNDESDV